MYTVGNYDTGCIYAYTNIKFFLALSELAEGHDPVRRGGARRHVQHREPQEGKLRQADLKISE